MIKCHFGKKEKDEKDLVIRIKHPVTGEKIMISDFKVHMDSIDMHMMKAKLKIGENGYTYICFRNPKDISMYQMRKDNVFMALAKTNKLDDLKDGQYNYLGTINYNEKDSKYIRISPTREELNYVHERMDAQFIVNDKEDDKQNYQDDYQEDEQENFQQEEPDDIQEIKRLLEQIDKELYDEKEDKSQEQDNKYLFKKRIVVPEETRRKMENYFNRKQENKENPFLRKGYIEKYTPDGIKKEEIYEGIDKTTGDYLILKKLQSEIVDGKYIYTGYLNYLDVLGEKNTKTDKELESYEVIFELPNQIDEMLEQGNDNSILELLAKTEDLLQSKKLNMLGKVEDDGLAYHHPYMVPTNIFEYYKKKAKEIYSRYNKDENEVINDNLIQFNPNKNSSKQDDRAI